MKFSKLVRGLCTALIVTAGLYFGTITAYAAGTGKATDDGVRIRATASKDGEVIGSSTKGNKIDIFSQTKDSEGNVWYKVTVSGDTKGYIRADYITDVSGDIPSEGGSTESTTQSSTTTETSTTETSAAETSTTEASTTAVNPSAYTFGTTSGEVSVRESPSTKANKVTTTATNQDVAITGEATGADGMVWYQINYGDITGFIRSDLITPGSNEPEEELPSDDELVEAPEVDEPVVANADYELRFEPNNDGVEVWYLYDNVKGTRQTLDNIFAVMNQSQQMEAEDNGSSSLKIVVIVLGVVVVLLVIAVFFLIFKLKDAYEDWEDDEDDDDDEDEEEEIPVKSSPIPEDDEELDDDDIKIVSKKGKAKKAAPASKPAKAQGESWKSNKFFEIDDDVEFEFLDIDK